MRLSSGVTLRLSPPDIRGVDPDVPDLQPRVLNLHAHMSSGPSSSRPIQPDLAVNREHDPGGDVDRFMAREATGVVWP